MRKELTVYINTNEEGEEAKVQRTSDNEFILLSLGQNRMVLNKLELLEAITNIDFYSAAFDEEQRVKDNRAKLEESRAAAKLKLGTVETVIAAPKKGAKKSTLTKEEEGTIVMDQDFSRGPTDSELALQKKMNSLLNNKES